MKTAKVEVGYTQLGNLTTEDQKTYYALIKQWEDKREPAEQTFFSIRQLARILGKRWGTNVIEATTESLRRLRTTAFALTNRYCNPTTGEELETLDTFTILSDLKIVRRKTDGHVTREAGYFRFHDLILNNLIANHRKPLLLDVVLSFKSEIAQLLYSHIDLILAATPRPYERKTKELFDELGLHGRAYRNRSDRRRKLVKALAELKGVPLSTGVLTEAKIEKTKDGRDFKVVFRRASLHRSARLKLAEARRREVEPHPRALALVQDPIGIQAARVVSRFHKVFHRVDNAVPSSKEIGQAVSLIANYGFDRAMWIIDFSKLAASEVNYKPPTFGGIMQYVARGLSKLEERQGNGSVAAAISDTAINREDLRIAEVLASMSESDYRNLYDAIGSEFTQTHPGAAWESENMERCIQALMVERIEAEIEEAVQIEGERLR